MSASPDMMRAMLMQQLMRPPQSGGMGAPAGGMGGQPGPQVGYQSSPMGTAAQMAQKIMLMRALQQRAHQQQAGQPGNPGGASMGQMGQPQTGPQPMPAAVPGAGLDPAMMGAGGVPPNTMGPPQ